MEDLTGKQLGSYQVVSPLGEGGMAAVFKAYQPGMERYVALKILPRHYASDPEFVGRFEQEAKVLASLQHPHILPVFDFGQADGYTYIVMPFLQSGDLTDLLNDRPLPLLKIRRIVSQIGDALDYAHQRGLVHRDVKPNNVLLDERGNCLLSDFGITKIVEGTSRFTVTGGIIGTPFYMSPEQGMGRQLDGRSDIYALGVMLYEMITGRVPYRADTPMAVVFKHVQDPLPPPRQLVPDLPEAVEQVILKALAKQPEDRYATAGEMVQALRSAIPESPLSETRPVEGINEVTIGSGTRAPVSVAPSEASKESQPAEGSRLNPLWIAVPAVIVFVVIVLCAVAFFVFRGGSSGEAQDVAAVALTATDQAVVLTEAPIRVVTDTPAPTNPPSGSSPTLTPEPTSGPSATPAPTDNPTPTSEPTDTPSPSPSSTSTPTASPSPTDTPSPTATTPTLGQNCSSGPGQSFSGLWSDYRSLLGCPLIGQQTIPTIAEEVFQGGHMFWRSDTDEVYIIYDRQKESGVDLLEGRWQFDPSWKWDGSNPDGVGLSPPPGLFEPIRGFGWLWRTHLGGTDSTIGWALDKEYGFDNVGQVQQFQQGLMFKGSGAKAYVLLNGGTFYAR